MQKIFLGDVVENDIKSLYSNILKSSGAPLDDNDQVKLNSFAYWMHWSKAFGAQLLINMQFANLTDVTKIRYTGLLDACIDCLCLRK